MITKQKKIPKIYHCILRLLSTIPINSIKQVIIVNHVELIMGLLNEVRQAVRGILCYLVIYLG